jgi:hypothetical protein
LPPNAYAKCPKNTSSIARPSKIDPNFDFWSENIPSGNPAIWAVDYFWRLFENDKSSATFLKAQVGNFFQKKIG